MVDSEPANSMFVFLFDDGSGEVWISNIDYIGVDVDVGSPCITGKALMLRPRSGRCVCRLINASDAFALPKALVTGVRHDELYLPIHTFPNTAV